MQELDDTKLITKAEQSVSFTKYGNNFRIKSTLQRKQQLFVNGVKIYQFKAKDMELIAYPVCFENISKDFSVDNMKQTRVNGYVYDFSVDYGRVEADDIVDIHTYLMNRNKINEIIRFINKSLLDY